MGRANGSRDRAPDDRLRKTHQSRSIAALEDDGFREGLNPSYETGYKSEGVGEHVRIKFHAEANWLR